MKKVSKELLGLVLDREVVEICEDTSFNTLNYWIKDSACEINLDTLTRLMKEWCFTKGYEDSSSLDKVTKATAIAWFDFRECVVGDGDNEHEAVTKVTLWVAKEEGLLDVK